jgi:hypothetical protein
VDVQYGHIHGVQVIRKRRSGRIDGHIASMILVPIGLAIAFSTVRFFLESFDIPADAEYTQVADALAQANFDAEKNRLAVLPAWSLRPFTVLKDYPWISGDMLVDSRIDRFEKLFVLVEPDGEDALASLLAQGYETQIVATTKKLILYSIQTEANRLTYDFKTGLGAADVFLKTRNGDKVRCDRRVANGFQCSGRKGWQRVTREHLLVSENGQEVMWAHPPAAGEVMTVRYAGVPLGDEIVFLSGHTRKGAKAKSPVSIDIAINNKKLTTIHREPRFDFSADIVDTSSYRGQSGTVEFSFRTENNSRNHFGFDAFARRSVQ